MRPGLARRSRIEELALMSCYRPFCRTASLALSAVAALLLLTPGQILSARAQGVQTGQHATLSDGAKSDTAKPSTAGAAGTVAAVEPANPSQQKSLPSRAIEKVKEVAKSAGDIFSRVPCQSPKGGNKTMGSLPHVASRLIAGDPVVIV